MRTGTFLLVVALGVVGCGPKPAPYDDTEQRVIMGIPPKILMKVPATHEPMTLHITTGLQVGSEPTGDPYRFIGGQRYGEGWKAGQTIPDSKKWALCVWPHVCH